MTLYEQLDRIEARPGLYFSRPGFDSLEAFFLGYDIALLSNHVVKKEALSFLGFREFVLTRLALPASHPMDFRGPTWQTVIRDAAADDRERFDLFFRLLREFRDSGTDA